MNGKSASLVGLALAALSLVTLLFWESLFAVGIMAIAVQIIAGLLMIWARLTFGRRSFHASANPTEGGLVTTGPYRFLRHPIYAAVFYFLWAGVVTHLSLVNAGLAILASSGLVVRMFMEERLVTERYP